MTSLTLLLTGFLLGATFAPTPEPPAGSPLSLGDARWGADGHRLVCEVALRFLTPEARAMVDSLLAGDAGGLTDGCVWADQVRPGRPETAAFHYVNIPPGVTGMDLDRDCGDPELRCAPWAIVHYSETLVDRTAPAAERREALLFVGHFVGDIHQPLHAGRPDDRGGNEVRVTFFGVGSVPGSRMDLHRIWDTEILLRAGLTFDDAVERLLAGISAEERARWENDDVREWTSESYRLNEDFVYVPVGSELSDDYFDEAVPFVEERLRQAGVRLAFVLNQAARGIAVAPLR